MNKQKKKEYLDLISFLNLINHQTHKVYLAESPDFVIEDNNQNLVAVELVEFFNDNDNQKRRSQSKKVNSAREKFRTELDSYLTKHHSDKKLWVLVEIDDTNVDYKVQDAIHAIENLLKSGEICTENPITQNLLKIQLGRTDGNKSISCFVMEYKGNKEPPKINYNNIIATIDNKTEIKKNWKHKFESSWLLIHLGNISEQYTLDLDFALKTEDKVKYSLNWERIYIFCQNRRKLIKLL